MRKSSLLHYGVLPKSEQNFPTASLLGKIFSVDEVASFSQLGGLIMVQSQTFQFLVPDSWFGCNMVGGGKWEVHRP